MPVTHKQDFYHNRLPIVQYTFELGKQKIVFDFLKSLFCKGGGGWDKWLPGPAQNGSLYGLYVRGLTGKSKEFYTYFFLHIQI